MYKVNRRQLLGSSAIALLLSAEAARATIIKGGLPWKPGSADPPTAAGSDGWHYFTPREAATVEAFVDRLIPPDPQTPGGKDIGCAVFIDRQLAGPYGRNENLYMMGPFQQGTKQQGSQSPLTAAQQYRKALATLDDACHAKYGGKGFADLSDAQKDEVITGLENGSFKLNGFDGQSFFTLILTDTRNGFLADPIYGGNRDAAAWKMIGFPGTHYDYRDWIDRHNERVTLPTVGIASHPNWSR
ncbi:MAG: gluconate 2-dehydrogenase subunit 3 family protein [Xanthobacteraceae bacterium]